MSANPALHDRQAPVRVVHGTTPYTSAQGSVYSPGISAESVGARHLFLGRVTMPAGARTVAHLHEQHETAMYMLAGDEVELWTGDRLQYRALLRAGDYLYVPAGEPHVAVNRSATEAVFIGARSPLFEVGVRRGMRGAAKCTRQAGQRAETLDCSKKSRVKAGV